MDCSHILYANDTLHHANNASILANGCVTTIGLLPIIVESWDIVQSRAVDPFAEFRSSELNKIAYSMIGVDNTRVNGLHLYLPQLEGSSAYVILSKGTVIKDSVLIRFLYDMKFYLGEWPLIGQQYIVVDYKYEVKKPPNIAEIKVINPYEFDPNRQMILYVLTYNGPDWPDDVDYEDATELTSIVIDPEKFVINAAMNNHTGNQHIIEIAGPATLPIKFIIGDQYIMTLYPDKISVETHRITDLAPPIDDDDAVPKHYVDVVIDSLHNDYYDKPTSDDRFVHKSGDTMSGALKIACDTPLLLESQNDNGIRFTYTNGGVDDKNSGVVWNDSQGFMFKSYNDNWTVKDNLLQIGPDGTLQIHGNLRGWSDYHTVRIESDFGWVDIGSKDTAYCNFETDRSKFYFDKVTRIETDHGWIDIGAQSHDYLHFYTDRSKYYFDKEIEVDGAIKVYNHDSYLGATNAHIGGINLYTGSTDPSSTARFNIDAHLYATRVINATYNDYAEAFPTAPGYTYNDLKDLIVEVDDNGNVRPAQKLSSRVVGIVSSNYAQLINGTEEEIKLGQKVPVAMSGTVTVKVDKHINLNKSIIGSLVVASKSGYAKFIDRHNYSGYVGCVVGKVISVDPATCTCKVLVMNM